MGGKKLVGVELGLIFVKDMIDLGDNVNQIVITFIDRNKHKIKKWRSFRTFVSGDLDFYHNGYEGTKFLKNFKIIFRPASFDISLFNI